MTKNAYYCKGHTCEIAEGISYENLTREFIVFQEGQSHHQEGDDDGKGENVLLYYLGAGA